MWKIHWESMKRIIDLGYQDQISIRYNSNMSRINYYGMNLFDDILDKFKFWNILASIDGAGEVGEYVRTGLKWDEWYKNIEHGLKFTKGRDETDKNRSHNDFAWYVRVYKICLTLESLWE
jgi:hypothetical protein